MKICLVSSGILPIPATKGGAIEQLVQLLIDNNEIEKLCEFTIICCHPEDESHIANYNHTKFVIFDQHNKILDEFLNFCRRVVRKLIGFDMWWLNKYNYHTSNYLKKHGSEFDYIVDEGCVDFQIFNKVAELYGRQKNVIHLHAETYSNKKIEKAFGKAIAISNYVLNVFKNSLHTSIQTEILMNTINLSNFDHQCSEKEKKHLKVTLGVTSDDFVVLYCGRLIQVKGVRELMKAVIDIDYPNIKLLIIGTSSFKGAKVNDYQRELQSLSDSGKIIFTGYIDNKELYKYHQISNVQVTPSLWEEAFCISLAEAMASGLPTIATKSGGMVEVGSPETTIFIEKNKDIVNNIKEAILYLYTHREVCNQMSEASIKRAPMFDGKRYLDSYLHVMEKFD